MSDLSERISGLSPKRLALLALELEDRLAKVTTERTEPIAVVGMACRFPGGASTPERFWSLLERGTDAIGEVPGSRWAIDALYDANPDAAGRMSTRWGGFIEGCDQFDPDFFGIAPREAESMDPQQRLLLEVTWEAIEDAAIAPESLHNSRTGVFVGICNSDYVQLLMQRGREAIDAYFASGNAMSVASGRLSYLLGLQGPAISVDTACSSSLVAVHLACQSLRSGECQTAVAAGVNLLLAPEVTIALSKAHMMAPDGRCKAFDAAANGFVRGEGCGVVVLKRLSQAQADGDRILALIRGTASNQDGRSSGLTAPNGPSQEAVIAAALAAGGLAPADVQYVEAHGTGTSLGDPIEVRALGAALGPGRDRPLMIGSVKTNIGHLESAAGIAGLIKVVLALQHERIPGQLHFHTPNPHIPWASLPVEVVTDSRPWRRGDGRRVAGVSSFGFSGTNAHVLLEEAPLPAAVDAPDRAHHVLTLSARSPEALREYAQRMAGELQTGGDRFADVCRTLNTGRARLGQRLAIVARDSGEAAAALAGYAREGSAPGVVTGEASGEPADVVFLFTGQGAQYVDMARGLYDSEPVFRSLIDRADAALGDGLRPRLLDALYGGGPASRLDATGVTQPALFAVECALAELWRAWGVRPSAVMGHSVGEIAAACVAGVMSFEDALRLASIRGRLMQVLPAGGRMAAIFASESDVQAEVRGRCDLAIAAINGPGNVVISGRAESVEAVLEAFAGRGIRSQPLAVSHAFHSPLMEPMVESFRREIDGMAFAAPTIGFLSNVSGRFFPVGQVPDAEYWSRHVLAPVRFAQSIDTAVGAGHRVFVEVGPQPTLLAMARRVSDDPAITWLPSLRKGHDDVRQMLEAAASLYTRGAPVDWAGVEAGRPGRRVSLPTYPFQRRRFWLDLSRAQRGRTAPARRGDEHPLLGSRLAGPLTAFAREMDPAVDPDLGDHRVNGAPVLSAPLYLELMRAAAAAAAPGRAGVMVRFAIREPLVFTGSAVRVQTIASAGPETIGVQVFAAPADGEDRWTLHATSEVSLAGETALPAGESPESAVARCPDVVDGSVFYEHVRSRGIEVGERFAPIVRLHRRDGEAVAVLRVPASVHDDPRYGLHPAILDAALLTVGAAMGEQDGERQGYVLAGIERVSIEGRATPSMTSRIVMRPSTGTRERLADLTVWTDREQPVARLEGVRIVRADLPGRAADEYLYDLVWRESGRLERTQAADFLPSLDAVAARGTDRSRLLAAEHGLGDYERVVPELDRAACGYVVRALHVLGVPLRRGTTIQAAGRLARLGVLPKHERLLTAMLQMLVDDGLAHWSGPDLIVDGVPAEIDPEAVAAGVEDAFPSFAAQARLLRACARQLAGVLRGDVDPLQLLFPQGSFEATEALYQHGPFARAFNAIAGGVVSEVAAALPAGRMLRCLEVGAGTGGTSTAVLPLLQPDRTEYWYTDLSKLFLERAAGKFGDHPFVTYRLFDVERPPAEQGVPTGRFDLVLAANAVHATADLRVSLGHMRDLLSPGGLLVLLEGTAQERWVDLTFGLLEGWWRFTDHDVRAKYPLLPQERWLALLTDLGFEQVATIPAEPSRQAVIVGRAPQTGRADVAAVPAGRRWLVVGAEDGLTGELVRQLETQGEPTRWCRRADAAEVARRMVSAGGAPLEVLHVAAPDTAVTAEEGAVELGHLAALVDALAAGGEAAAHLWMVSAGAQAVGEERPSSLRASLDLGFGRVVALEHPDQWGGSIDVDPAADPIDQARSVLRVMAGAGVEDQIAVRGDVRYVARIAPAPALPQRDVSLRPDATYLITGGTGGIAIPLAHWMVERGARHLLLLSRRGLPPRERWDDQDDPQTRRVCDLVRELEQAGASIEVAAADVTDEAQLTAVLNPPGSTRPPLRGVVHAAVAMSNAPARELRGDVIEAMLRPKVDGTNVLERLTRSMDLDFFVLFSSTTALWGAAGLAHYAAANAYLDAMAASRADDPRHFLSVNWGTWDEMRVATEADRRAFERAGLGAMPSSEALDRLGRLIVSGVPRKVVALVDWVALKPLYEARRARPLFAEVGLIADAVPGRPEARAESTAAARLVDRLRDEEPAGRRDLLTGFVSAEVAHVLGRPASEPVPGTRGLFEMGMDSLMSVELRTRLEQGVGHPLPSTLTFNYPTVDALVGYLIEELGLGAGTTMSSEAGGNQGTDEGEDNLSEDDLADLLASRLRDLT